MTRQRRTVTDSPAGSWRPSDAELGWIIENRVDEANPAITQRLQKRGLDAFAFNDRRQAGCQLPRHDP
jgi:hypothetical protein